MTEEKSVLIQKFITNDGGRFRLRRTYTLDSDENTQTIHLEEYGNSSWNLLETWDFEGSQPQEVKKSREKLKFYDSSGIKKVINEDN